MPHEVRKGLELWRQIEDSAGKNAPVVAVLRALIKTYPKIAPQYIPAYDMEKVINDLGYSSQTIWKPLVDFLCFDAKILELGFRLIEGDDHYEISFETLQLIIGGDPIFLGSKTYSSTAAQNHIFPYFIPTEQFRWLLDADGASNV